MQMSIIVSVLNNGQEKLNTLLERDWKVVQMCPMPCGTDYSPTCLVIVEKFGVDKQERPNLWHNGI